MDTHNLQLQLTIIKFWMLRSSRWSKDSNEFHFLGLSDNTVPQNLASRIGHTLAPEALREIPIFV